jgi:hypothetical protein
VVDLKYFVEKQGLRGTNHDVKTLGEVDILNIKKCARFLAQNLTRMVGNSNYTLTL